LNRTEENALSVIATLIERRSALKAEAEAMLDVKNEAGEARDLTDVEDEAFNAKLDEIKKLDARIGELQDAEKREAAAAAHRVELGIQEPEVRVSVTAEPNPVYRQDDPTTSFFRDLAATQLNRDLLGTPKSEAYDRLVRSQETRAGDLTTVAGAGGEFAPPLWQVENFAALARAGRVTADLCQHEVLPAGVSSVNLPKVASGVTVAVQQTQNSALSDTAMTTTSVSTGITTVGGKQIVSLQLLQQSGIPFDRVILQDLAKAYAVQVDNQVLYDGTRCPRSSEGSYSCSAARWWPTHSIWPSSMRTPGSLWSFYWRVADYLKTSVSTRWVPACFLE